MATVTQPDTELHLLNLPAETRNQIYDLVCANAEITLNRPRVELPCLLVYKTVNLPLQLSHVCRQFREEIKPHLGNSLRLNSHCIYTCLKDCVKPLVPYLDKVVTLTVTECAFHESILTSLSSMRSLRLLEIHDCDQFPGMKDIFSQPSTFSVSKEEEVADDALIQRLQNSMQDLNHQTEPICTSVQTFRKCFFQRRYRVVYSLALKFSDGPDIRHKTYRMAVKFEMLGPDNFRVLSKGWLRKPPPASRDALKPVVDTTGADYEGWTAGPEYDKHVEHLKLSDQVIREFAELSGRRT